MYAAGTFVFFDSCRDTWKWAQTSETCMKTKMGKTRVSIEIYQPYFVVHLTAVLCLFIRMRKDELNAISGPNEFAEFYNRLKQIKEFHRKHPNEVDCRAGICPERHTSVSRRVFCVLSRSACPCPWSLKSSWKPKTTPVKRHKVSLEYVRELFAEAVDVCHIPSTITHTVLLVIDRCRLFVCLYNRYAEPIFIYCYKVNQ